MKEFLGFFLIIAGVGFIAVAPAYQKNQALEAENQALQAEIKTLEQRYIDQLLRSQQND